MASNLTGMVYTEAYGMSVGALSVVITLSKCIDFLVGFAVGYVSDNAKSIFGRRKPFIAVGGPIAALCMLALVNPPDSIIAKKVANHSGPGLAYKIAEMLAQRSRWR